LSELGPDAGEQAAGGAVEAVVDCSLAVVAEAAGGAAAGPQQQQEQVEGAAAAAGAGAAAPQPQQQPPPPPSPPPPQGQQHQLQLLLSRGHGDIVLMRRRGDSVLYSNVVHPIRPRLPYTGVRPFVLEAALAHPSGDITA
ncbi:hypothetical protein Agub_g1285, partial [Astrephomene gubernaculifera]